MIRLTGVVLVVLLAAMAITNPGQDAHKRAVCETVAASKTKNKVLGKIAAGVLENTEVLTITYNNYYLMSTCSVQGQIASVGIFSRVWKLK